MLYFLSPGNLCSLYYDDNDFISLDRYFEIDPFDKFSNTGAAFYDTFNEFDCDLKFLTSPYDIFEDFLLLLNETDLLIIGIVF